MEAPLTQRQPTISKEASIDRDPPAEEEKAVQEDNNNNNNQKQQQQMRQPRQDRQRGGARRVVEKEVRRSARLAQARGAKRDKPTQEEGDAAGGVKQEL